MLPQVLVQLCIQNPRTEIYLKKKFSKVGSSHGIGRKIGRYVNGELEFFLKIGFISTNRFINYIVTAQLLYTHTV